MSTGNRPLRSGNARANRPRRAADAGEYWAEPVSPARWRLAAYPILAVLALALLFGFKAPTGSSAVLPPAAQVRGTPSPSSPSHLTQPAANRSGTYVGAVVQDPFGPVQVRITLAAGKLTDVTAVQLPSQGRSGFISQSVAPILKGEAIAAQSALIDTVSGATYTSEAYAQSLQSALDAAHA